MTRRRLIHLGLSVLVFMAVFYVLNFLPVIHVTYDGHPPLPPSRWCSLNFWYCYNDYTDGGFPTLLKSDLLSLFVFPIALPGLAAILAFRWMNRSDGDRRS
jgi:hypothetical protein